MPKTSLVFASLTFSSLTRHHLSVADFRFLDRFATFDVTDLGGDELLFVCLGDVSLERADFVEAATERRLLVSGSFCLPIAGKLTEPRRSEGTLLGGTGRDSREGVESPDEPERRSGVEIAGLCVGLPPIIGVLMGVGVLLKASDGWKVFGFEKGAATFCRRNAS